MRRVLLVHPGVRWSVSDVEAGLCYGLERHGVEVVRYRLDERLIRAKSWLYRNWRARGPAAGARPTTAEALLQAGMGALEQALRESVDAVVIVSAILLHPDVVVLLRRAGLRVYTVFTESPYDHAHEVRLAALVDGCWTHERTVLPAFRAVNPNSWYLPHGWHPERHFVSHTPSDARAHDVVFVGSGFRERIAWFNAIDWTGIDLGLYGTWRGFGLKPKLEACVYGEQIDNATAAALYRRAKIGLNLYRRTPVPAESLNPRAYELAACGVFSITEHRKESVERFGGSVPSFATPQEAETLIREFLIADTRPIRRLLPLLVGDASWTDRAGGALKQMLCASPRRVAGALETPSEARLFDGDGGRLTGVPASAFPTLIWPPVSGRLQ